MAKMAVRVSAGGRVRWQGRNCKAGGRGSRGGAKLGRQHSSAAGVQELKTYTWSSNQRAERLPLDK